MAPHSTQSFFTPKHHSTHDDVMSAKCYNLAHVLLNRTRGNHLFIPIRSMQILAIIEPDVIWFVDSMAHAVQDGEAGRIIAISWAPQIEPSERDSLEAPVPYKITHYGEDRSEMQKRLQGEFLKAMELLDNRFREKLPTAIKPRILPFTGTL